MSERRIAPYGSWSSPISADLIATSGTSIGSVLVDLGNLYWTEMRPSEGGRVVLVHRAADGSPVDLIPAPYSARTTVHEYGGGAVAVKDGTVLFSNFSDQRLYRCDGGNAPRAITPEGDFRYSDGVIDVARGRVVCVREDHHDPNQPPLNTIVSVPLDPPGSQDVLASGNDFYSSPRLSPDGTELAWLTWNHPNMPWDGTELWVGRLNEEGGVISAERVAGGPEESIFQPEWSPAGILTFVSDRSGWWNLYQRSDGEIRALHPLDAEFGAPQWVFGMSLYAFVSEDEILCAYGQAGWTHLGRLRISSGSLEPIDLPYASISSVSATGRRVYFLGASPSEPPAVVQIDLNKLAIASPDQHGHAVEVIHRATDTQIDARYISAPTPIEFPTEHSVTAHGFLYLPTNPDFASPNDERPPLLVMSHGGPTSATSPAFRRSIQYWTSRGIAVLDVNYGGSSGYGRPYRERLSGEWGVVDVDDCVNGGKYLVAQGLVDGDRLAITGGSAGGYTTLCALTFRDLFRAGASHYGVSDCEALARDTHKFEARYLDKLIGPYPERRDLYFARSPINFADRLSRPVIFLQGLEDRIVPPNQAETMVSALRSKAVPVAYVTFEGEQHGFRRAENIRAALEAELYFYSRVFGFNLADPVPAIEIDNLDV